jgi:hypothetical protein
MGGLLSVQVGEYGRLKDQLLSQEELQVSRKTSRDCLHSFVHSEHSKVMPGVRT